jgi:hypothetical protein
MFSLRFRHRAQLFSVATLAAFTLLGIALPATAEDTSARPAVQAKRAPASFGANGSLPLIGSVPSSRVASGFANGFLYLPGPQPLLNVGGRVPVGKSHVYVPYYGDVSGDPTHPTYQGVAGIAYGFRTWDISVVNGGFTNAPNAVPGGDQPKANPSLSLSIRF